MSQILFLSNTRLNNYSCQDVLKKVLKRQIFLKEDRKASNWLTICGGMHII
jgi:hypothetical protein